MCNAKSVKIKLNNRFVTVNTPYKYGATSVKWTVLTTYKIYTFFYALILVRPFRPFLTDNGWPNAPLSSYVSSGIGSVSSKHHSDLSGFFSTRGASNLRWHVSFGIIVHSCFGVRDGTNFVANRQVFCGFKSHTSSGTSTRPVTYMFCSDIKVTKIRFLYFHFLPFDFIMSFDTISVIWRI